MAVRRLNVFLFGPVGAGKSTICASLARMFFEEEGLAPEFNLSNRKGSETLLDWVKRLNRGDFPPKTEESTFIRVDGGFKSTRTADQVGVSFFEVSGEDLLTMTSLEEGVEPPEILLEWLSAADVLVVVAGTDNTSVWDEFLKFLARARQEVPETPTAFVLAKWDLAEASYGDPLEFAKVHFGAVLRTIKGSLPQSKTHFSAFSVGLTRVGADGGSDIESIDPDAGARELFSWLIRHARRV